MKHWRRGSINTRTKAKFQDDKDRERTFKKENNLERSRGGKKHKKNLRRVPHANH